MKVILLSISLVFLLSQCTSTKSSSSSESSSVSTNSINVQSLKIEKVTKTEEEWKAQLSPEAYYVTRERGTERAFTGPYWDSKEVGVYNCVCCDLPLFSSDTKFKSGTGWPSFYKEIKEGHVGEISDSSYGMTRVEIVCNRCNAHLGHVFPDGPKPTGLRYCVNGHALKLSQ